MPAHLLLPPVNFQFYFILPHHGLSLASPSPTTLDQAILPGQGHIRKVFSSHFDLIEYGDFFLLD